MRTSGVKNGLIVGVILLFIGIAVQPSIATVQSEEKIDIEHTPLQVTITKPENGIYINNHKVLPFFMPLILCGAVTIKVEVIPNDGWASMEFYLNGVIQEIILGPGPVYEISLSSWTLFSKINLEVIAFTYDGNSASDEITIWRIFR